MKGISRRARTCAVVAATGVAVLSGSAVAQAQKPEKLGEGVPTGQGGVQLFNYNGYINNGGSTGTANPVTGVSAECLTSTTTACRWQRLDRLFAYLSSKGITHVELFQHQGIPANTDIDGEFGWKAYRAMLDRNNLHAGGWHGSMNEAGWDARVNAAKTIGADYIGSGGVAEPGITTYDAVLRSAEALNRLGKRSVEAGVGPAYIHNHTDEFDRKYVDNGVLKTAFDILMERTDPRYVVAELDTFWSSDAFGDASGAASAELITKYAPRMKMLHIKDGINLAPVVSPTNSRTGQPRALGTGEHDFRPIFAAAKPLVQYYFQEQDGGTLTDAEISTTNLKGVGSNVVGTVLGLPTTFNSAPAGTAAANNVTAVTIKNTGDAPLTGINPALANSTNANSQLLMREGESPADFQVINHTCGTSLAAGASCVVNVGFKPTRTNFRSVARLIVQSSANNPTESVLLVGSSTGEAVGGIGGDVPTTLSLNISAAGSFGTFIPATARTYETAAAALVTSTAGDATLSVTDPSSNAPGHLVNGAYSLPSPLQVRATNAANANSPWAPLSETAGAPQTLLTYNSPTAGAETATIGFRQSIGATDVLRSGNYSKTLTFTLSTTAP